MRVEGGGRTAVASRYHPGYETDSGMIGADWQAALGRASIFARYERRSNVDATSGPASYRQHEASGHLSWPLKNNAFVVARWADGNPLVLRGSINGRTVVELNMFPASTSHGSGEWDAATDAVLAESPELSVKLGI